MQPFFNFKTPRSIVSAKEKGEKGVIREKYIPTPDGKDELVTYMRTEAEDVAITMLRESKETRFRNSPAVKAYIDYVLANRDSEALKFTHREIAQATGFDEDVIRRARKRVEKELPIIRELLQ
ncbi:MAG: hypothetical protein ACM3SR_05800 [Ignavibacteriales bacterium]